MAFKITTDDKGIRVFRKDREYSGGTFATYFTKVSSKDKDGNYKDAFLDLQFRKGVSLNHKAEIIINNAFFVTSEYKDNVKIKLMVMDFDVKDEGVAPTTTNTDGFMNIPEGTQEELPFC